MRKHNPKHIRRVYYLSPENVAWLAKQPGTSISNKLDLLLIRVREGVSFGAIEANNLLRDFTRYLRHQPNIYALTEVSRRTGQSIGRVDITTLLLDYLGETDLPQTTKGATS